MGRRLIGNPAHWDRATQNALHAMKEAAEELNVPAPEAKVELNDYVRKVTDEAANAYSTDAVFKAKVDTITAVFAERRAYEGQPCDEADYRHTIAAAALALAMVGDLEMAAMIGTPEDLADRCEHYTDAECHAAECEHNCTNATCSEWKPDDNA